MWFFWVIIIIMQLQLSTEICELINNRWLEHRECTVFEIISDGFEELDVLVCIVSVDQSISN